MNKETLSIILALGLIIVSIFAIFQFSDSEERVLNTIGSYSSNVAPDTVKIDFSIISFSDSAVESQNSNRELMNNVFSSLKAAGLSDDEIKTIDFRTDINRIWDGNKYLDSGFQTINSIRINTKKIDKAGEFIDIASSNGVNNINNLRFVLSDEKREEVFQNALASAGKNARDRADVLAKSIGFKVKGIKSINIEGDNPIYFAKSFSVESLDSTPISPGNLDVDVRVSVSFIIN